MADDASPKTLSEIRVRDPLSDVTRKERKALLGVSLVGLVIAKTGLLPTEISALGIKFDVSDQKAILNVIVAVVLYFSVAFLLYAASDFLAWRIALNRSIREAALRRAKLTDEERITERDAISSYSIRMGGSSPYRLTVPVSVLRAILEFIVPLLFAGYAATVLLTASPASRPPNPSLQPTATGKPASAAELKR